ncbi:NAD(P)/FAD-dependent oxidoreductase [Rhodococcus marinonascens]|uniref:NAD(P)/FAD-dependent oxidoreductase n=1 Tax=Rhodococcus marinonascens TaxID=38311 RepID=UPI000933F6AB|nr:NAD(P)/FAD-dependent oxidoreductase [Rhodococcus marinonascens]
MEDSYEVVVIGGGAAGLSGALALSRARRTVLVIDAGDPRNAPAEHIHNYLGREGTPPGELLMSGRDEVSAYGGEVMTGTVTSAEPLGDGTFRVVLADGKAVLARRLLVTTGLVDELPDIPGLAERWGRDVLHCPYCHGWEIRDQPVGVLATGPLAIHQALMWRQWTDDVTLFLGDAIEPTSHEFDRLAARGIAVVDGAVAGLQVTGDRLAGVRMHTGQVFPLAAVVVTAAFAARSEVLESLGLEATDQEMAGHVVGTAIASDATGATAIPGVWVAGNVTDWKAQVITAAAAGLNAAAAINGNLIEEDTRLAVEAKLSC